jgi:hypothetical protein
LRLSVALELIPTRTAEDTQRAAEMKLKIYSVALFPFEALWALELIPTRTVEDTQRAAEMKLKYSVALCGLTNFRQRSLIGSEN